MDRYLMGRNEEDKARIFSVVTSKWTWGNRHKLKYRKVSLNIKNPFQSWEWLDTGTGCPVRLWSLHPWRYSRCNCAQSWTTCSSSSCFDQRVAPDNLQRHLPTSAIPSFCDTSIYLFPRFYPIILILFIALGKKWTEQALWKMSVALSNYLERIWESIFQVISILELWQSLINSAVFSSPCACWRFSTPYMDV